MNKQDFELLRQRIGKDELRQAVKFLLNNLSANDSSTKQKEFIEDTIKLSRRLAELDKKHGAGEITFEENARNKSQIASALLSLINRIENSFLDLKSFTSLQINSPLVNTSSLEKEETLNVIIPAAAPPRPQLRSTSPQFQSGGMVPLNGKPILGWILESLPKNKKLNVFILINEKDNQTGKYISRLNKFRKLNLNIIIAETEDHPQGLANSIFKGLIQISRQNNSLPGNILIILSHTILPNNEFPKFKGNWAMFSEVEEKTNRWCYININRENGHIKSFIDKPHNLNQIPNQALIGVYFFEESDILFKCLEEVIYSEEIKKHEGFYQLSQALKIFIGPKYRKLLKAIQVQLNNWYDAGSISGLHKSKKLLLEKNARAHNKLFFKIDSKNKTIAGDDDLGILTKISDDIVELRNEAGWYDNLPPELKSIAPRVFGFDFSPDPNNKIIAELKLEYFGYNTLEEAWLYQNLHPAVWKSIINHLLKVLRKFREYKFKLSNENYDEVYLRKTEKRILKLKESSNEWKDLLNAEEITIKTGNDVYSLRGYPKLEESILNNCERLFENNKHTSIIHGDFQLANILYDVNARIIKLVDPRGSFGRSDIYGDCKYDLAKLRHSLSGGYNLIVNDLFECQRLEQNRFKFEIEHPDFQEQILLFLDSQIEKDGFEKNDIIFIEGLLFLSMIPIHEEKKERQYAMFLTGLKYLNQVLNRKSQ